MLSSLTGAIVFDCLPFSRMQSILDRMPRLIRPIRRVAVLAIRVAGVSLVLVGVAVGSGLRAQAPKRLPVIAGNTCSWQSTAR